MSELTQSQRYGGNAFEPEVIDGVRRPSLAIPTAALWRSLTSAPVYRLSGDCLNGRFTKA